MYERQDVQNFRAENLENLQKRAKQSAASGSGCESNFGIFGVQVLVGATSSELRQRPTAEVKAGQSVQCEQDGRTGIAAGPTGRIFAQSVRVRLNKHRLASR